MDNVDKMVNELRTTLEKSMRQFSDNLHAAVAGMRSNHATATEKELYHARAECVELATKFATTDIERKNLKTDNAYLTVCVKELKAAGETLRAKLADAEQEAVAQKQISDSLKAQAQAAERQYIDNLNNAEELRRAAAIEVDAIHRRAEESVKIGYVFRDERDAARKERDELRQKVQQLEKDRHALCQHRAELMAANADLLRKLNERETDSLEAAFDALRETPQAEPPNVDAKIKAAVDVLRSDIVRAMKVGFSVGYNLERIADAIERAGAK